MTHYRNGIRVDFGCNHPEIKNNACPTGRGNCEDCRFCVATLSAQDYFKLERRATKNDE